jgi:N-acetyl-anhydromuramyl-L-alanine amidase AmpD
MSVMGRQGNGQLRRPRRVRRATLGLAAVLAIAVAAPAAAAAPRQQAFADAAAAYGPMHLTDVAAADQGDDLRGDPARPLAPLDAEALHTVDLAARLTGSDELALRTDPVANVAGGAAVLAEYQRRIGGAGERDPADWYGAVAAYSGARDAASARAFADDVYAVIASGAARTTDDGERVVLPARAVRPDRAWIGMLGLRRGGGEQADCPRDLGCEWIPAPYEQFTRPDGTTGYGNHDLSDRPENQTIRYIVIHDTEADYATTLGLVQDPTYVSWHYTLRSADGHVAQHVRTEDVAWHAGNWFVNAKSIGLEHEGFAAQGSWYTEAMYRASARLVRYLARRYDIPLDRHHILGHDNVQGPTAANVQGMHWDPGPYWDWSHYFDLLRAPFRSTGTRRSGMVTIKPDFDTNQPPFTDCDAPGVPCAPRGSSSVILRTEPRDDAPLVKDIGLHPDGGDSTMAVWDHGSRVDAGTQYAVADRAGDWIAIWYLGQKAWFRSPRSDRTALWARGLVATPRDGLAPIPVYGRAYPEAAAYPPEIPVQAVVPLQYTLPAGQRYVVGQALRGEYYWATTFDAANHRVVRGRDLYFQIQFGHRTAYVKASDVRLRPSWRGAPG